MTTDVLQDPHFQKVIETVSRPRTKIAQQACAERIVESQVEVHFVASMRIRFPYGKSITDGGLDVLDGPDRARTRPCLAFSGF